MYLRIWIKTSKNIQFFWFFSCWVDSSEARWLLVVPVMISMLISLLFLINVMRIMLTKSHNNASNTSSTIPVSIRRAVRAALILTPLFGLHHILLPFRPTEKSTEEAVYDVFSALLISLQVSIWYNHNRDSFTECCRYVIAVCKPVRKIDLLYESVFEEFHFFE